MEWYNFDYNFWENPKKEKFDSKNNENKFTEKVALTYQDWVFQLIIFYKFADTEHSISFFSTKNQIKILSLLEILKHLTDEIKNFENVEYMQRHIQMLFLIYLEVYKNFRNYIFETYPEAINQVNKEFFYIPNYILVQRPQILKIFDN